MRSTLYIALAAAALYLGACTSGKNNPGTEYAPQMYYPIGAEYSQNAYNPFFKDKRNWQSPPKGSVARGKADYHFAYANTPDDYEKAGTELKNPLPVTEASLAEGKVLYGHYCTHCHGEKGDGQGAIPKADKFPPPPSYFGTQLAKMPDGKKFFSITYGKNVMGSHASQLSPDERWKVIHYINKLRDDGLGTSGATATADTTKAAAPATKK